MWDVGWCTNVGGRQGVALHKQSCGRPVSSPASPPAPHSSDERRTHTDQKFIMRNIVHASSPDCLQPLMPGRDEEAAPCPVASESDSRTRLSARPSAMISNLLYLREQQGIGQRTSANASNSTGAGMVSNVGGSVTGNI